MNIVSAFDPRPIKDASPTVATKDTWGENHWLTAHVFFSPLFQQRGSQRRHLSNAMWTVDSPTPRDWRNVCSNTVEILLMREHLLEWFSTKSHSQQQHVPYDSQWL